MHRQSIKWEQTHRWEPTSKANSTALSMQSTSTRDWSTPTIQSKTSFRRKSWGVQMCVCVYIYIYIYTYTSSTQAMQSQLRLIIMQTQHFPLSTLELHTASASKCFCILKSSFYTLWLLKAHAVGRVLGVNPSICRMRFHDINVV